METETLTIADFLLARVAEDEAVAEAATPSPWFVEMAGDHGDKHANIEIARWRGYLNTVGFGEDTPTALHVARHDPSRVLAECEAKRRIVEMAWHHFGEDEYATGMEEAKRQILAEMALPYADHPDFRPEWRP